MISMTILAELVMLAMDTFERIAARKAARAQLSQGEKIRAALEQTQKNSAIYQQIVAEAKQQIAESGAQIGANVSRLEALLEQLRQAAQDELTQ